MHSNKVFWNVSMLATKDGKECHRYTIYEIEDGALIEYEYHLSYPSWKDDVSPETRRKFCSWKDVNRASKIAKAHDENAWSFTRGKQIVIVASPYSKDVTLKIMMKYFKGETEKWELQ